MKNKNKPTIIAMTIALLFIAGCSEKADEKSQLDFLDIAKKEQVIAPKTDTTATNLVIPEKLANAPIAIGGNLGSDSSVTTTKSSSKRVSSYPRNDSSISNQVAIQEIEAGNPYTSIVSVVEGYRARPYSDVGQGFAVGNGWNMSFQSAKTNRDWATQAGLPESMIKNIVAINGRMQGPVPTGIEITPKQATTVAIAMRPLFEKPAIRLNGQAAWNKLQEHQKAVLVYHVAKVGAGGAAKYKGLIKAVQTYANNPTDANAQKVVSHITYGYKIKYPDGTFKQMQDHRSQLYMGALFVDPQQYRYLLGKSMAPTGFSSTANTAGFTIDTTKAAEAQVSQQDVFNKEIDSLAEQGIEPQVKQEINGKTNNYSMELEPQTKTVCIGNTTLCKKVPVDAPKQPQPIQEIKPAKVAPNVEIPKIQGSCKAGSYESSMKLDDGTNMPYCVIRGN